MKESWTSIPFDRIDACLTWPAGVGPDYTKNLMYMFSGDKYISYDCAKQELHSQIRDIKDARPDFPFDAVDATVIFPQDSCPDYAKNIAYMFYKDEYIKWDLTTDSLAVGPRKIKDGWPGLPLDGLDAAIVFPKSVGTDETKSKAIFMRGGSFVVW
eukprot:CAMPEP_0113935224 /NCGR_PEP_ID=MMETSP1339-20121228/2407_1 /TAXON_ID=94617 /ORGANISM="Fibrocapsa japonica" /LENGTH=155 /DNA_ID=CAMNT_0000937293 /DNA_START=385 /DNA_END=849 /DNA_ORIENTATION=- /assembly_acc=CAM_ASM_000762